MTRLAAIAVLLLALAAPASAQTHPCDIAQTTTSVSTKVPFTIGFCVASVDADGNPTTLLGAKVYIDAAVVKTTTPMPAPIGAPNAAGLNYYEIAGVTTAKAPHTLTVSVFDVDAEGPQSGPLPFSVKGAGPKAPVGIRIR
jgi:hypothetical protein